VGTLEIGDRQVRSQLPKVDRACPTCRRRSEDEAKSRVHAAQSCLDLTRRGQVALRDSRTR
jgi:hypothetical protein